jgi:Kinase binding protein CGI-121
VKVIPPVESGSDQSTGLKDAATHLKTHVSGTQVPLDDNHLSEHTDIANIQKIYKIPNTTQPKKSAPASTNGIAPSAAKVKELERIIIGMMAIKGS